jgi:molybdenum cofactor cytidylyltransferase
LATVASILLAAGESARMGRPKPLLDWGGETLIEYQTRQLTDAGTDPVVVVLGHSASEVRPAAERAGGRIVENEAYREGRASSVRRGASELLADEIAAVVILDVDQPRPAAVLRRLIDEHAGHGALISIPVFGGTRGHPPAFDESLLPELSKARDESMGLRAVVERHSEEVNEVEFDSEVVLLGFNTPAEFEAAREAFLRVAK